MTRYSIYVISKNNSDNKVYHFDDILLAWLKYRKLVNLNPFCQISLIDNIVSEVIEDTLM